MGTTTEIKENKDIEVVENAEGVKDAEAVEDVQEIKPYTLRNPKATDIAAFLKLFSKLGVKDFKDSFSGNGFKELIAKEREKAAGAGEDNGDTSKFLENVGIGLAFELVDVILAKLSDCQREVFVCLSRLSGMTVDEVANLDLSVFTQMLYDAVTLPGFADFIKVVSRLFEKRQ